MMMIMMKVMMMMKMMLMIMGVGDYGVSVYGYYGVGDDNGDGCGDDDGVVDGVGAQDVLHLLHGRDEKTVSYVLITFGFVTSLNLFSICIRHCFENEYSFLPRC